MAAIVSPKMNIPRNGRSTNSKQGFIGDAKRFIRTAWRNLIKEAGLKGFRFSGEPIQGRTHVIRLRLSCRRREDHTDPEFLRSERISCTRGCPYSVDSTGHTATPRRWAFDLIKGQASSSVACFPVSVCQRWIRTSTYFAFSLKISFNGFATSHSSRSPLPRRCSSQCCGLRTSTLSPTSITIKSSATSSGPE
jgi:hypothetical protein